MILYHRTDATSAQEIVRTGTFLSFRPDRQHAFFTNQANGWRSEIYGAFVVEVEVDEADTIVDEYYPTSGERYYRVPLDKLGPANITGAYQAPPRATLP